MESKATSPRGWVLRLIYFGAFTLVFFAYIVYRGNAPEPFSSDRLLNTRMLLSILSIFQAYILTLFYRQQKDKSKLSFIHFMRPQNGIAHLIFVVAVSVSIVLLIVADSALSHNVLLVLGSYLFGVACMLLLFSILLRYQHKKIIHDICTNFGIVVSAYVIIGNVFYDYFSIFKFMIDWYPFGNILLNF